MVASQQSSGWIEEHEKERSIFVQGSWFERLKRESEAAPGEDSPFLDLFEYEPKSAVSSDALKKG
jgi:hypothetical protein